MAQICGIDLEKAPGICMLVDDITNVFTVEYQHMLYDNETKNAKILFLLFLHFKLFHSEYLNVLLSDLKS